MKKSLPRIHTKARHLLLLMVSSAYEMRVFIWPGRLACASSYDSTAEHYLTLVLWEIIWAWCHQHLPLPYCPCNQPLMCPTHKCSLGPQNNIQESGKFVLLSLTLRDCGIFLFSGCRASQISLTDSDSSPTIRRVLPWRWIQDRPPKPPLYLLSRTIWTTTASMVQLQINFNLHKFSIRILWTNHLIPRGALEAFFSINCPKLTSLLPFTHTLILDRP